MFISVRFSGLSVQSFWALIEKKTLSMMTGTQELFRTWSWGKASDSSNFVRFWSSKPIKYPLFLLPNKQTWGQNTAQVLSEFTTQLGGCGGTVVRMSNGCIKSTVHYSFEVSFLQPNLQLLVFIQDDVTSATLVKFSCMSQYDQNG